MDISRLRLNGFSSGIDIDEMVKKLMNAKRIPLEKMKQQKQIAEWQRDDYREMNKLIWDLRSASSDMRLQKSYGTKSTAYAGNAFSVTASIDATEGVYSFKVNKLAEAASLTSGAIGANDANKKLSDLTTGLTESTLTISGSKGTATINVSPDDTLDLVMRSVNAKTSTTGVRMSYDSTLDRVFFTTTGTGDASSFSIKASDPKLLDDTFKLTSFTAGKVTGNQVYTAGSDKIDSTLIAEQTLGVSYNGKNYEYKIDKDTSIDQLIAAINGSDAGKAGISAYLDENKKLALFVPDGSKSIEFSNLPSNSTDIIAKLGLPTVPATPEKYTYGKVTGTSNYTAGSDKIDSTLTDEQTLRVSYNGKVYDYKIDKDMSIDQLITTINGSDAGKAGISAYLDENKNLAFFVPDGSKQIEFKDMTSNSTDIVAKLGLSTATPEAITYNEIRATGTNASVTFNNVTGSYSSNTVSINGMTFTLKEATGVTEDVTVAHNTQGVFDSIKAFVDKYNDIIDKINTKLTAERYRSYAPLTDEQKENMKEKDIERWEERAKSGLIRRDQTLESALNQLRSALSSGVTGLPSGELSQLSQIGISTLEYSERGKLHIDETKLKKAISDNPEQIMRLFTADDGNKDSRSGDGIANRIYQISDIFNKQIVEKAGSASTTVLDSYAIGKSVKDLDKRIDALKVRLIGLEDRYYKQFTAMEKAISQMNSQSTYLTNQFGGA